MNVFVRIVVVLFLLTSWVGVPARAAETRANVAPEGFRALFNGKDLAGWGGMGTENPYKLAVKTDAERAEF